MRPVTITVSIGLAPSQPARLLHRPRRCGISIAKHNGRNRVEWYQDTTQSGVWPLSQGKTRAPAGNIAWEAQSSPRLSANFNQGGLLRARQRHPITGRHQASINNRVVTQRTAILNRLPFCRPFAGVL